MAFRRQKADLHSQLRSARPEADDALVDQISRSIADSRHRPAHRRMRLTVAGIATLAAVVVMASLGGVGYAASTAGSIAHSVTGSSGKHGQSVTPQDNTYSNNDFLISAGPKLGNRVSRTGSLGATIRLIGISGYPYDVTSFSGSVLPSASGISFSFPAHVSPGAAAAFTVNTNNAPAGFYLVTIRATGHGGVVRTSSFLLHVV